MSPIDVDLEYGKGSNQTFTITIYSITNHNTHYCSNKYKIEGYTCTNISTRLEHAQLLCKVNQVNSIIIVIKIVLVNIDNMQNMHDVLWTKLKLSSRNFFGLEFSYLKGEELWKSKCLHSQNHCCFVFQSYAFRTWKEWQIWLLNFHLKHFILVLIDAKIVQDINQFWFWLWRHLLFQSSSPLRYENSKPKKFLDDYENKSNFFKFIHLLIENIHEIKQPQLNTKKNKK
jgi:hypothetical protein